MVSAGLLIAVLTVAFVISTTRDRWKEIGERTQEIWWSMKPDTWIARDAIHSGPALTEFFRRYQKDSLTNEALESYIRELSSGPVSGQLILTLEWLCADAWSRGKINESLLRQSMATCMNVFSAVGTQSAHNGSMRYAVHTNMMGLSKMNGREQSPMTSQILDRRITINGKAVPDSAFSSSDFALPINPWFELPGLGNRIDLASITDLPDGEVKVEIQFTLRLTLAVPGKPTVTEEKQIKLSGVTKIVDRSQMFCMPLIENEANQPQAGSPKHFPSDVTVSSGIGKSTIWIGRFGTACFVGGVYMKTTGVGQPRWLGNVAILPGKGAELDVDFIVPKTTNLILIPNNELGVELFGPETTIQTQIDIPAGFIDWSIVSEDSPATTAPAD